MGDADSLARAIGRLKDDQAVRAMAAAAYERYWAEPLTLDRHLDAILGVYDKVRATAHSSRL